MAKWIWNVLDISKDAYAVFKSNFNSDTNKVTLKICADTNYMVLCNNKLVAFDQYPCYPDHPVYDELPIKCKIGENEIKIIVYYNGENGFSTYAYSGQPGLYFEVKKDDKVLLESNEKILSTRFLAFENGHCSRITNQQGFRAFYDATKLNKIKDYRPSIVVNKSTNFTLPPFLVLNFFPSFPVTKPKAI